MLDRAEPTQPDIPPETRTGLGFEASAIVETVRTLSKDADALGVMYERDMPLSMKTLADDMAKRANQVRILCEHMSATISKHANRKPHTPA